MKKIAFYCSGGASRVIKFLEGEQHEDVSISFILYDGGDPAVSEKLNALRQDETVLHEVTYDGIDKKHRHLSESLLKLLDESGVDWLICFGDKILKGEIIKSYKDRIINFHPSLLPAFPGVRSIDQALKTSVKILGNTAHIVDEGVDTGAVIMQSVLDRNSFKGYEDVLGLQLPMLRQIIRWIAGDRIVVKENIVTILNSKTGDGVFYPGLEA